MNVLEMHARGGNEKDSGGSALCELQVANLLLAAGPTHEWYKERFPSYPRQRRALIPWVY